MMRQFNIDFRHQAPYECGAILITLLAYPEPTATDETLGSLCRSLCHLHLRATSEIDPEWAGAPQPIKPLYAFVDPKQLNQDLRQLKRRLRDRMVAARVAIGFLKEVVSGKVPKLPAGLKNLSLNQLSILVLDDLDSEDEGNVETRVWRPSLPVIHLAAAMAVVMDQVERTHKQQISFANVVANPDLARLILTTAATYVDLSR
jgi:hypothetical protein